MSKISVIGAGSWGTALAVVLANNGHRVSLWGRDPVQIAAMRAARANTRYLPQVTLPPGIDPSADLAYSMDGAELYLLAVPSHAFADQLGLMRAAFERRPALAAGGVLCAAKGFSPSGGELLHSVVGEVLGSACDAAVLSGPSFAREVAAGLPTAVTLASSSEGFAARCASYLHAPAFRVYTTGDVVGVQVGGAVKNVLAIAAGILDGLGFGANARAALITRGLVELTRFGVAMGGRRETFAGLAGLGDLLLTCTDNQSRNRSFGLLLASGVSAEDAFEQVGQVVEGAGACRLVARLAEKLKVEMPICAQVHQVLFGGASPRDAVQTLLARERKSEFE